MAIDALNVTMYPRDGGPFKTTTHLLPGWEIVEHELRSMDNWEKPILWLHQNRSVGDSGCLAVCGGSGVYHIQVADTGGDWREAIDSSGSEEQVDVWLSDQGFTTARKLAWPIENAIELVRWYFEHGSPHPNYTWR